MRAKADDVRLVAPLMMEESLVPIAAPELAASNEQSLCYEVTGGGLLEPGKRTWLQAFVRAVHVRQCLCGGAGGEHYETPFLQFQ